MLHPGPVITLPSTSWERSRWRWDFSWPQGCVVSAARPSPLSQLSRLPHQAQGPVGVLGVPQSQVGWVGTVPQGPGQTQRVLGAREGPGWPWRTGLGGCRDLVRGAGEGRAPTEGARKVLDVREAALWKGDWAHQESNRSLLGATSASREGGNTGGRRVFPHAGEVPRWREGGKWGAWARARLGPVRPVKGAVPSNAPP